MRRKFAATQIELVIKITKYCNLRCSYCYEFPNLGNKEFISLKNLEKLLRNVSSFQLPHSRRPNGSDDNELTFIWHGGEPFMVPMPYYTEIGALQKINIAGPYVNSAQTNLTILTNDHLEDLIEQRFFHRVGFSFDVYGDQRVDIRGRSPTVRVLKNLQLLREYQIPTGAIVVLSRSTKPYMKRIFQFYDRLGINMRMLPYHIEAQQGQTAINGLHPDEIAASMCEVFDLWLQSKEPIQLLPLDQYIEYALAYMNRREDFYFDKEIDERVFIVNTNGDTYGFETYLGEHRYGNLFHQSLEEVLYSETRMKLVAKAAERVDRHCSGCRFFGACTGYPVAEATPLEEKWLVESGCYVAKILAHIIIRFEQSAIGIAPTASQRAAQIFSG